jgi:hypothetical protein
MKQSLYDGLPWPVCRMGVSSMDEMVGRGKQVNQLPHVSTEGTAI